MARIYEYSYPDDDENNNSSTPEQPIAAALTEFHIILLYKNRLKAICILNNVTIYEETVPTVSINFHITDIYIYIA